VVRPRRLMPKACRQARGCVVLLEADDNLSLHERRGHQSIAKRIAEITDREYAGDFAGRQEGGGNFYYVPHRTLVGSDRASVLGIVDEDGLYGGIVPEPFIANKGIMHPLPGPNAVRPDAWNHEFSSAVEKNVLSGYTAFSRKDALAAARRLLQTGPVRLKWADAAGGAGQMTVESLKEVEHFIGTNPAWPLVLEMHLRDIVTLSVGRSRLAGTTISYFGTQEITQNNYGEQIYGGSHLIIMKSELRELEPHVPGEWQRAVRQAIEFDAELRHFPGIIASRRNYDVGLGYDSRGNLLSGVLDQSWRVGGCSGIEVEAVRIFQQDANVQIVKGSTLNRYGAETRPPDGAWVHFEGIDDRAGAMIVYTQVHETQ